MGCSLKMLCRVPVRAAVATADVAAILAEPQVHPRASDLETVFAAIRARRYFHDGADVFAILGHWSAHLVSFDLLYFFHAALVASAVEMGGEPGPNDLVNFVRWRKPGRQ